MSYWNLGMSVKESRRTKWKGMMSRPFDGRIRRR